MKKYYEILGLTEDATLEDVNDAFLRISSELYHKRRNGEISLSEYGRLYDEAEAAHDFIISDAKNKAADELLFREVRDNAEREAEKNLTDEDVEVIDPVEDELESEEDYRDYEEAPKAKKSGNFWKWTTGVLALALVAVIGCNVVKGLGNKDLKRTGAHITGSEPTVAATMLPDDRANTDQEVFVQQTPAPTVAQQTQQPTQDYGAREYVVNLGDVENDTLVRARAQELVDQMNAAGLVNSETTVPYTVDEVFKLIKYANGVYAPSSLEEIDILHLQLLNILISPINHDDYLYHIVFATGNNDFNALLNPNPNNVGFAEAFAAYGNNGVYPLIQWIQQKRFEMYSSTNREEINAIYREVGQVMADLMKGNGATITVKSGKEAKEGITYTFTAEQVLANHSSAIILTTEAQLIFANHYQIRNEQGVVVDEVNQTWEVYNRLNSDGVDANGYPIINPDLVTYDEINAWINNSCDYVWGIDEVLIDGQTFGQRIQTDLEGMAQNNYYVNSDNRSLGK